MNALSILISDNYKNENLSGLVRKRTLSSIPIGSRYRLIDFMLSSLVEARISNIVVLANNNYDSLVDHLGSGKDWDLSRKNSGLKVITPLANDKGKAIAVNKFDALSNSLYYLDKVLEEYVIIADANIIANVDFNSILNWHMETNADITIGYAYLRPSEKDTQIVFDDRGRIYDSLYHMYGGSEIVPTQLEIQIMSKRLFREIVEKGMTLGWENMMNDYISKNFNKLNVYGYEIRGYCRVINNIRDYYDFNMDLLNDNVRSELFLSKTEILTRVKDSVPTFYGENADVKDSILADGSIINGYVENSVISRDVVIEEGAVVKNSIIMTKCYIEADTVIENTIIDRYSRVTRGTRVSGTRNEPYIIHKGTVV